MRLVEQNWCPSRLSTPATDHIILGAYSCTHRTVYADRHVCPQSTTPILPGERHLGIRSIPSVTLHGEATLSHLPPFCQDFTTAIRPPGRCRPPRSSHGRAPYKDLNSSSNHKGPNRDDRLKYSRITQCSQRPSIRTRQYGARCLGRSQARTCARNSLASGHDRCPASSISW